MNINQISHKINFILFLITLLLNLVSSWDSKLWEGFSDVKDYLHHSSLSPLKTEFYFSKPEPAFYPRPFTVPLFFKIAGSKGEAIVQMQKFIHSIATFVLAYSMLLILKTGVARIFIMFAIYFFMSWWNILGWTTQILSESLSMSFLFLWIGTFLVYFTKRTSFHFVIHCIVTILFSFTRDSWPYILLLFYGLVLISVVLWDKKFIKGSLMLLAVSLIILFVQGKSSEIGQRTKLPVINTLILRILPEKEYFNWFVVRGMPMAGLIKQRFSNLDVKKETEMWKLWSTYRDPEYQPLRDWAAFKGKNLYASFLISHPKYTFLLEEPKDKIKRIFSVNPGYVTPINGYSIYAEKWFPFFSPMSLLVYTLLLILIFWTTRNISLLFPPIFSLLFLFHVFLIYNADTLEVERHLFITMIMIQFLCIWSVALLIDEAIQKMRLVVDKHFFNNRLQLSLFKEDN